MEYIVHRRFKQMSLSGVVNLPALTECELVGELICCNGQPICVNTSENAHQYFALNTDGQGMKRGEITQAIQKRLAKRDDDYQNRWDKIWEDSICQKYKRQDHIDYWLWNHEFFNAPIIDLLYIANLVGLKGVK